MQININKTYSFMKTVIAEDCVHVLLNKSIAK